MRFLTFQSHLGVWANFLILIQILECLFFPMHSTPLWAADPLEKSYEEQEAEIPKNPNPPPPLAQKSPSILPKCERFFKYRGKLLHIDSMTEKDAAGLRSIVNTLPAAVAELDEYNAVKKKTEIAAYATTLGLVAMVTGILISRPPIKGGQIQPGGYPLLGGLGLVLFSVPYSFIVTNTNESHLDRAVELYNAAYPQDPIRLEFKTSIHF